MQLKQSWSSLLESGKAISTRVLSVKGRQPRRQCATMYDVVVESMPGSCAVLRDGVFKRLTIPVVRKCISCSPSQRQQLFFYQATFT